MFFFDLTFFFYFYFIFIFFIILFFLLVLDYFLLVLILIDLLILINILLFVTHTIISGNPVGYCYAIIMLGVAAADTAVGLGVFVIYYKITNSVSLYLNY